MKRVYKVIGTVMLLLMLSIAGCIEEGLEVGNRAPDFELFDLDNQQVSLSDFRGQPVLLNFWATWCWPCRSEMPYLHQINEEWSKKGLVLLAVDVGENKAAVGGYLSDNKLDLPVLLDTNGIIFRMYKITNIPTTFFIDKDGIIQKKIIGAFPNKESIETELRKIVP